MHRGRISNLYFTWLVDKVCEDYQRSEYEDLLRLLYSEEFVWSLQRDENRASDGYDLRSDFRDDNPYISSKELNASLPRYCTVLEMLVALSIRCEDNIMHDPNAGDRTGYWFWLMIHNIGLDYMCNNYFDEGVVINRLYIFMSRRYRKDGSDGALFVVPNPREDLRKVEIWYQMNWYLESLD